MTTENLITPTYDPTREIHAARGATRTALGWGQEAAMRMLQNNLDPAVAEYPEKLVVYGGTGKAARDWRSYDAMIRSLQTLKNLLEGSRKYLILKTQLNRPIVF